MKPINVLSFFDGMSCGMLALKRAGIPVGKYYAAEIDPHAIKVSKNNFPEIKHLGSVVDIDCISHDFSKMDIGLFIGGSPCQGFSFAGKQLNFEDSRSRLFFEFVRVLKELRIHNPKVKFLLENVKMKKEFQDIITGMLGVEPVLFDSAELSPQARERLYWSNIPLILGYEKSTKVLKDIMEPDVDEKYFYNHPLLGLDMSKSVCARMDYKNNDTHKRILNPNFKCHTLTTCSGGNTQKKVLDRGRARKLTPMEYERLQTVPDDYTKGVAETQRYNMLGNGWTVDVIAHLFQGLKYKPETLDLL